MGRPSHRLTLGAYLDNQRQEAGLSYRRLAALSGVPHPTIQRLINDEVREPSPHHLVQLADTLEIRASDLFLLAGLPVPTEVPSVDAMLRAEYDLSEDALAEVHRTIAAIAAHENRTRSQH